MKKYVVAYYNHFNGELLQELVEANTELDAALCYMQWAREDLTNMSAVHSFAADCEATISVLDVTPVYTKRFEPKLPSLASPANLAHTYLQ